MSSASSAVTYTFVYTDSKLGRPVAPPSPDYIPGPKDPQTPPVPQDEDEREAMFIQPYDPDYVPDPIYPEYIPLKDEHEFLAEEQPLPPVVSPTAESPGYVTKSDLEEDPEEYEDDETEDGPVDYPMDGGEDKDDDDGDSSRDDADDEDEEEEDKDDEDEEEEEHLAPANSAVIVPTVDLASISLPSEAKVERLLAMPTPPPSPPISLSPPSTGERLARIASTQALIDAVTAELPSPPLPPLPPLPPSLYIPPPVDRRDDIPESEQPPRKRSYLFALGPRNLLNEKVTPSDIQHSAATQIWGCYRLVSEPGYREPAIMSSASSTVTYTSVYTDSEPGRVFWGSDEEVYDGGSPRVIVLGYGGLPIQPVAPPSPDYIPDSEEPQTPPVPQDEDEREHMFIQPHDPDYVPEPMYLEYIPLEDEHVFLVEEQPLPPVVSPTAESPGYVVESDPEEDPKEYGDDETEDGPVDYPMDRGEDGDDDNNDSTGDDADDKDEDEEDEDEEDEEEEEHLAPADSTVVVPTASISLPPEAEVERLLAMPTSPPSPPISLSPPSVKERIASCTAPSTHSSPPPMPSPLLPSSGCPTQIQTLRIASTQALVDAVTTALPSPPLPPLPPSLYIPPPVDRRDDIPESEQPPRKRSCLFSLGSRYEVGESSTARPIGGQGVDLVEAVPEIEPMTMGEVNTRVTELAELHEHDTQDLYALLEDAQDGRTRISQRVTIESQRVDLLMEDRIAHQETILITHHEQQAKIAEFRETDRRHQAQMVETLCVMRDMRREMGDMQAELLALREQQRRARQPGPDIRVPDHQHASRDADSHI
ncbi:hypothetical protein Tco_1076567 [Tanacetum coccineum]